MMILEIGVLHWDGTLLQKDAIFAKKDGLLVKKAVELSQGKS